VASTLVLTAGDNPHRLYSERFFAVLCSAGPIPASSGKTTRYRLNRGGDRQANAVLWRIAVVRLAVDSTTKAYLYKRFFQGKTKSEAVGCLKLYIARGIFNALPQTAPA